jgi:hypothetical protein
MFNWLSSPDWLMNLFWYALGGIVVGSCVIAYFKTRDKTDTPHSTAVYDAMEEMKRVDDETAYRLLRDAGILE